MGLTESNEIDEHWRDNHEQESQHEQLFESDQQIETKQQSTTATSTASLSLNKTQRANLLKKQQQNDDADDNDDDEEEEEEGPTLNEDALNEEKMWIDAISQEPKSSHLRNQLANHYFSQNRLNEAEFTYKAAINLDKTNTIAHYDYAFMRHHQFYWSLAKLKFS